jgi:hypothetical protein
MTMTRAATTLPWHTSRTRSFTKSQDLSLLSIARLNKASSRVRFAILEADANRPDILHLQRRLLPYRLPFVPGDMLRCRRGVNELLHDGLPIVNDESSLNPESVGSVRRG